MFTRGNDAGFLKQKLASGNARNQRCVIVSLSTLLDPIGSIEAVARTTEGGVYRRRQRGTEWYANP
jgi:hypothetical protein